jgi:hypothetical protein
MTLLNKILLILLGITVVGALGFIVYQQHEMSTMQAQINTSLVSQKQLLDGITRSQAQYVSKADLDAFAKQNGINLAVIQADLDGLNATVSGINQVAVSSSGENQTNLSSSNTTPNPNPTPSPMVNCNGTQIPCPAVDPFGYQQNKQTLSLDEPFGTTKVPVGSISFSAWQQTPWGVNLFPRTYSVTNVLGTDPEGKQYVYNKFTINSDNKSYPITIANAKFEQELPSPSLSWWNPRLFAGADLGIGLSHVPLSGEFVPNLSVGAISYGQSKVTPNWSFLQVGVGYGVVGRSAQVQVSPVQYNIGQHLTLIRNTYVGPVLGVGFDGNVMVGAGIRVGL